MNISIKELNDDMFIITAKMVTELMNYHRKLNNAPKKYWHTLEEGKKALNEWLSKGSAYNILLDGEVVGFLYVRYGGQDVAWLEDLYIAEEYRGKGIGRYAMNKLDKIMEERGIVSMFVDVIPRNTSAMEFYTECGFDHLNLIQLRKNYDKKLNKQDEVEILGFNLKKY
ncbi:GNAT family N-acetyltransferase [Caldisalinibacter kiritimatiensis]|uniref:N-acetyltransferase domain-containing protein n=1 Tax=Caldisalinibacter kiritimatiensis TaxID=1304284 RepID=R1CSK0_9FIRM|nr:GNAT family N-acetyltransferase [Caldisalinibacter kiritimatiensis]EOC99683.1 hypothetical protein L21TH_2326 [Caldisalinibacter kiritimatiensis]